MMEFVGFRFSIPFHIIKKKPTINKNKKKFNLTHIFIDGNYFLLLPSPRSVYSVVNY
jgi:hypothetical protein